RWDDSCTIPSRGGESGSLSKKQGGANPRLGACRCRESGARDSPSRASMTAKHLPFPGPMPTAPSPSSAGARVLVVTVNYRTAELAIRCLASLESERRCFTELRSVIVDNDSRDGSAERLRIALEQRGWGGWAHLVENSRNVGFGAGNNLVLRPALAEASPPDYFLLLNPDAAVDPGAVAKLDDGLPLPGDPECPRRGPALRPADAAARALAARSPPSPRVPFHGLALGGRCPVPPPAPRGGRALRRGLLPVLRGGRPLAPGLASGLGVLVRPCGDRAARGRGRHPGERGPRGRAAHAPLLVRVAPALPPEEPRPARVPAGGPRLRGRQRGLEPAPAPDGRAAEGAA